VEAHEAPGEREAEPRALLLLRVVVADLAELLEHELLVLDRDADAGVAHRHLERAGRAPRDHVDAAAVRVNFTCVG